MEKNSRNEQKRNETIGDARCTHEVIVSCFVDLRLEIGAYYALIGVARLPQTQKQCNWPSCIKVKTVFRE